MIAIGLDPSFSSFGISDGVSHERIETLPGTSTFDRANVIVDALWQFIELVELHDTIAFFVEGPSFGSAMAGALHDAGYLMARVDLIANSFGAAIYVVPPASLKKFVTGKGNTKKTEMPLKVYKKWHIEFEDDPGADKLHAYCLHRYGQAVLAGEIEHAAPKARGKGKDRVQAVRRAARTKAGVA